MKPLKLFNLRNLLYHNLIQNLQNQRNSKNKKMNSFHHYLSQKKLRIRRTKKKRNQKKIKIWANRKNYNLGFFELLFSQFTLV